MTRGVSIRGEINLECGSREVVGSFGALLHTYTMYRQRRVVAVVAVGVARCRRERVTEYFMCGMSVYVNYMLIRANGSDYACDDERERTILRSWLLLTKYSLMLIRCICLMGCDNAAFGTLCAGGRAGGRATDQPRITSDLRPHISTAMTTQFLLFFATGFD